MDIWIVENIGYGRYRIKELDPGRMEVEVLAQWYAVTYPDVIVFFGTLDTEVVNPYLPDPLPDGHHSFIQSSYRCTRCGVYNRPDVESEKAKLDAPCPGRYQNSGKMRAWAEEKWAKESSDEEMV